MDETYSPVEHRVITPAHWPPAMRVDHATAAANDRARRRDKRVMGAVFALIAMMMLGVLGLVGIAALSGHSSRDLSAHDRIFGVSRPTGR